MADHSGFSTRPSLIFRMQKRPADENAWQEFVDKYGPLIFRWCRSNDVLQLVLQRLWICIQKFEYDPKKSFRGWLRTMAHRIWLDDIDDIPPGGRGTGGSDVQAALENVKDRDGFDNVVDRIAAQELRDETEFRVQRRVEPQTWEAYCLKEKAGLGTKEVAKQMGMTVSNVYKILERVRAMIKKELDKLDPPETNDEEQT